MQPSPKSKKILISDAIEKTCVEILQKAGFQVDERDKVPKAEMLQIIKQYDGLIVRSGTQVTADIIKAGVNLKLIGRAGTGVDNIDLDAATKKGIMVMNTPGGNTASAAELTVSLLLALTRNIPNATASLKSGKWDRKKFMGTELAGKTLGVVGLGQIGRRVAKACQALGMKTIGYDPLLAKEVAAESLIDLVSQEELYEKSDFITLHSPLTADTRNMLNDATFAKCKKGVRIVNCARGGIIDEAALLRAIESGKVAGAALDVFEKEPPPESLKPLLQHPAIICTPHLGASTEEAQEKVAQEIATQFVDALEGRRLAGVVNSRILTELHARREIHPFVELSERIGSLQAQLLAGNLQKITLTTRGSNLKDSTGILTAAALKGILSQITEENVNFVNAPALAQEFGLKIDEVHETVPSIYGSSVSMTFHTDHETLKLVGTVGANDKPRLVQIDDYNVELSMAGRTLFFSNQDKPGVMGKICTSSVKTMSTLPILLLDERKEWVVPSVRFKSTALCLKQFWMPFAKCLSLSLSRALLSLNSTPKTRCLLPPFLPLTNLLFVPTTLTSALVRVPSVQGIVSTISLRARSVAHTARDWG